jgi:cytosine/adenosine deaminase-related metal-dependent hydrolase
MPGAYADIIMINYNPPTPINEENIFSHLNFGIFNVDTVIIGGKVVMKNKELRSVDEYKIFREARLLAKKIWERM